MKAPVAKAPKVKAPKVTKKKGTRTCAGAVSDRQRYMRELNNNNDEEEVKRHITGRMYINTDASHYNPSLLHDKDTIWFEKAKPEEFTVMDCIVHSFNYAIRYPLFTHRDQMHELALARCKKAKYYLMQRKVNKGYPPVIFDNFVVKGNCSYSLECVIEINNDNNKRVWENLKIFVEANMVQMGEDSEFVLVGQRINEFEELESHATTIIRLERWDSNHINKVPVLVHLDCNNDRPACTHPALLERDSDQLSWRKKFSNY